MCVFISSLPGKTNRMFVELRGLQSYSTCVLKAEPGTLQIKSREPGILYLKPLKRNWYKCYFFL